MISMAATNHFPDIIVTSPNGIWTDTRAYSTLDDAITAVGADVRDLYIVREEVVTDLNINSNTHLKFFGIGSISNSGTLNIDTRNITAGDRQIFTGTGDINFANGTVVRSAWFSDINEAITQTNGFYDYLTLIISEESTISSDVEVGDKTVLKWESARNRISVNTGVTLSNVKRIEAGEYQIFSGSGDIDFLDGTILDLSWFKRLNSVINWVETEKVTLEIKNTYTMEYDNTIPPNMTLKFYMGSIIDGTNTLTINGVIDSERFKVFGDNLIVAGNPIVSLIWTDWFDDVAKADTFNLSYVVDSSYTITDENLPYVANMDLKDSGSVNNALMNNIVTKSGDDIIGLHHNHLEQDEISLGSNIAITSGNITTPPYIVDSVPSPVDIVAFWYQDFGLEYTRAGNGATGNLTWYYWDWNFTTEAAYDQARQPIFGWYRGDDANVLDWQCYWLRKYGVKAVSLVPSKNLDLTTWATPSDKYYWLYQLFNNTPNFKGLQYMLWAPYSGAGIQTQWEYLIDNIYFEYENFYTVEHKGELYPVIYVFEGILLAQNIGAVNFTAFCTAIADKFKAAGYGGVAMFIRHPSSENTVDRQALENAGCLYYAVDYSGHGSWLNIAANSNIPIVDDAVTYELMMDSFVPIHKQDPWAVGTSYLLNDPVTYNGWIYLCYNPHTSTLNDRPENKNSTIYWVKEGPISREIQSVPVSKYAVAPHPSQGNTYFRAQNPSPDLFAKWLRKAINNCFFEDAPRIVMVYNVSEWAEAGPGLTPNMQDGFGYLNALKRTLLESKVNANNAFETSPRLKSRSQFVTASSTIINERRYVELSTDNSRTLTSTPTIEAGQDGQRITLTNINTNASYTIILQDETNLAGSNLFLLGSTDVTLSIWESIELQYFDGKGWVQIF